MGSYHYLYKKQNTSYKGSSRGEKMEIKLELPMESHHVLDQLIEQCGEYDMKYPVEGKMWHYLVLGEHYNVEVNGYRVKKVTLLIKPERTL